MKISRTHQILSKELNNPEVLTNPEPFLGPNWETVLRWWLYYDSLIYEQKRELWRRHLFINDRSAWTLAEDAAIEVIGRNNWNAVYGAAPIPRALTYELIAMHLLLELGYQLTFVPLVNNL